MDAPVTQLSWEDIEPSQGGPGGTGGLLGQGSFGAVVRAGLRRDGRTDAVAVKVHLHTSQLFEHNNIT